MSDKFGENSDDLRWHRLNLRRFELRITEAFKLFRASGIEPILIKGWAAARLYPADVPRFFSDIDLAVPAADFAAATDIVSGEDGSVLGIDLHRELRRLDTLEWGELFRRSETVDVDGVPIRVLCPEDHLRVLSVHWLNDGGEYRERLWDIYYAAANRPADFDWSKCLDCVSKTRRTWIITTIGLAHKYLGLYIDDLPFAAEAGVIPKWITDCVEREWKSEIRLRPLHVFLTRHGKLFEQIFKRIPPNPIQSTIDMEGRFDEGTRIFYQIGSIFKRIGPSIGRISGRILPNRRIK